MNDDPKTTSGPSGGYTRGLTGVFGGGAAPALRLPEPPAPEIQTPPPADEAKPSQATDRAEPAEPRTGSRRRKAAIPDQSRTRMAARDPDDDEDPEPMQRGSRFVFTIDVPNAVKERFITDCARQGLSYGERIIDAFDAQYDALAEKYPPIPARRPGLPPRKRPRRQTTGDLSSLQINIVKDGYKAVHSRQKELAVASRSEFYSAILELEFPDPQ